MYFKRAIKKDLLQYMKFFPVILITGARQVGKSTMCLNLDIKNYVTLDDISVYENAKNDPIGFISSLQKPVIIDEIQKLPELLVTIKQFVDTNRVNGQFILTGSANLLGFKNVSDSLAGRIGILELYPLNQKEINKNNENLLDMLFAPLDKLVGTIFTSSDISTKIIDGGYPELFKIDDLKSKYLWFSSYIMTYIQRDTRDLANIRNLDAFIKMYKVCMLRSANIFNKNDIQKECGLDNKTFDVYFSILKYTYQMYQLAPYFSNEIKKLVKTPKIFATDSGVMSHLLQIQTKEEFEKSMFKGSLLETFVFDELLRASSSESKKTSLFYYRTTDKKEIDFILKRGEKLIALEIKSSKTIRMKDFANIVYFKESVSDSFDKGIILYRGDRVLSFGDSLFAIPMEFLL